MAIRKTVAYLAVMLAVAAEVVFVILWASDPRERPVIRVAVLFWPLFIVFLAEAMRMWGAAGEKERLRRELLRLQFAYERDETDLEKLARGLDHVDLFLAPVLLCGLPVLALALGLYLWKT